jgi:hypothetical protein
MPPETGNGPPTLSVMSLEAVIRSEEPTASRRAWPVTCPVGVKLRPGGEGSFWRKRRHSAPVIWERGRTSDCQQMTDSGDPRGKSLPIIGSVATPPRKIMVFRFTEIYGSLSASHPHQRGVSRSSRTLRAGCGGLAGCSARMPRGRRHPDGRRSRVVLVPRRWDQVLRVWRCRPFGPDTP